MDEEYPFLNSTKRSLSGLSNKSDANWLLAICSISAIAGGYWTLK